MDHKFAQIEAPLPYSDALDNFDHLKTTENILTYYGLA